MTVEVLVNLRCELAEGPFWDDQTQRLYWVNILAGQLHCTEPASGKTHTYSIEKRIGAAALRSGGGFVLATEDGFAFFDPDLEELTFIDDPEADRPGNRFNDGKCDPAGRFWAGTMAYSVEEGAGALYRLGPDGRARTMVQGLTISNGLAWSNDHQTMYHIDTIPRKVYAYDYDVTTGEVTNRRVAIDVAPELGYPDGMCIDTQDKLWIAHVGAGCVRRWDPNTSDIMQTISLPTAKPTSCSFGGKNLKTLFITTAWEHMSEAEKERDPLAGALFAVELPYQGQPPVRFAG